MIYENRIDLSLSWRFAWAAATLACMLAPTANAQIFSNGVFNVPPDTAPSSVGDLQQLNVSDGGSVGDQFDAFSGSEVNISGGTVGFGFDANAGSVVNVSGGSINNGFAANSGSEANISGGNFGIFFDAEPGSDVELIGGEFKLNGEAYINPTYTFSEGDVFTGTLQDGSAFIFTSAVSSFTSEPTDRLNGVTLTRVALPAVDTTPLVANSPVFGQPSGLRSGQTLTLQEGGLLPANFEVVDATLNVEGGSLGVNGGAAGSEINISGGSVGPSFYAGLGSEVNISGGYVGPGFNASFGSEVNILGGSVGSITNVTTGSVVNIAGGFVNGTVAAGSGGVVSISGGTVGPGFDANAGSVVNVSGGSIGVGSQANPGSLVNISGGIVGDAFRANAGSVVNVSGGLVSGRLLADSDSVVNVSDGVVRTLWAWPGSEVNISGGSFPFGFDAYVGSEINISGGSFGDDSSAHSGSEVNSAHSGSEVNLFGTEFSIDGEPLDQLTLGEAFTISDRYLTLSGIWEDGSAFHFEIGSDFLISYSATLTVTLVDPNPLFPGDFNDDAIVNAADYVVLRDSNEDVLQSQATFAANFGNIQNAALTSVAVPEPGSAGLLLVCFFGTRRWKSRSHV